MITYISDLREDVKANESAISAQSGDLSALDAFSMRSFSVDSSTSFSEETYTSTNEQQYRSVSINAENVTALAGDFIAAKGICTITLEEYAREGSRIKIVNLDGTAITIQGMIYHSGSMSNYTINSVAEGAVYDFQFHVQLNGWILV